MSSQGRLIRDYTVLMNGKESFEELLVTKANFAYISIFCFVKDDSRVIGHVEAVLQKKICQEPKSFLKYSDHYICFSFTLGDL